MRLRLLCAGVYLTAVLRAGVLGGGGDGDSYCDSEASLDGSCYDQLEDPLSPPPDVPQTLDLRHAHHEASSAPLFAL
jgi:hypothetical protein